MIRLRAEVVSRAADGLDGLKSALQSAIELEHATLPPYLYALTMPDAVFNDFLIITTLFIKTINAFSVR